MSEFVDLVTVNDLLPDAGEAINGKPWYEKALLKGAPHQYRELRLLPF